MAPNTPVQAQKGYAYTTAATSLGAQPSTHLEKASICTNRPDRISKDEEYNYFINVTKANGKIDRHWLLNVTDFLSLVCPWLSDNNSNLSFKFHESQELSTCLSGRIAMLS